MFSRTRARAHVQVHLQEQWDVDAMVRARTPLTRLPGARLHPSTCDADPNMPSLSCPRARLRSRPCGCSRLASEPGVTISTPAEGAFLEAREAAVSFSVTGVWMPEEAYAEVPCTCNSSLGLQQ